MMSFVDHIELMGNVSATIENYRYEEIEEIYLLERKANPYPWSRTNFIDSYNNGHICAGVKVKDKWIAHAVFMIAAHDAELLIIAVDPNWQQCGVAKLFLKMMFARLAVIADILFLEVRESNLVAIKLYESLGLNCTGRRPGYYPIKNATDKFETTYEDALLYAMDLSIFKNHDQNN